ncbi:MAG: hypothetical protein RL625_767 [Gemmatimonadota bacterium]
MRLLEDAADALARIDAAVTAAPFGAATVLRIVLTTQLASGTRESFLRFLAADCDPFHDTALSPTERVIRELILEEERRARSGGIPALARLTPLDPTLATYLNSNQLEAALRDNADRSVLERLLAVTAWAPSITVGECLAALTLVSTGRTNRLMLLPFIANDASTTRTSAIDAWRAGEETPWRTLALTSLISHLTSLHDALRAITVGQSREDERLTALGRAAVTTRPALALLRRNILLTMPILAEDLDCSRPAAQQMLERLTSLGVAREFTGRGRDRVWGYAPAIGRLSTALE